MVQDQQAQLITHQGHIKVPMEKIHCLTFKAQKDSSALKPTSHSPGLTLLASAGASLAAAQNYCKFPVKVVIGSLWVMTGPWKLSPAMGQSIWDPCVWQSWHCHTHSLAQSFPCAGWASQQWHCPGPPQPIQKGALCFPPSPRSIPKRAVTLLEMKSLKYTQHPNYQWWIIRYHNFYKR